MPSSKANVVKAFRIFFRDFLKAGWLVESFKLPPTQARIIKVPSKQEMQKFYNELRRQEIRVLFLLYASSGLRFNEVLSLIKDNVNFELRLLDSNGVHKNGTTKKSYFSFYNHECETILKEYLDTRTDDNPKLIPIDGRVIQNEFKKASLRSGIHISAQVLRDWFCQEMGELGVPDRFIDAFCGRTPKSVLARHYSDYSPERLKAIYDKAGLKILVSLI